MRQVLLDQSFFLIEIKKSRRAVGLVYGTQATGGRVFQSNFNFFGNLEENENVKFGKQQLLYL